MPADHLHLDGANADHPEWMADEADDDFDPVALEAALLAARRDAYQALRELAPA